MRRHLAILSFLSMAAASSFEFEVFGKVQTLYKQGVFFRVSKVHASEGSAELGLSSERLVRHQSEIVSIAH